MSKKVGNVAIILAMEEDKKCEFCDTTAECRPYGPGGKQICHKCATVSPEMMRMVRKNMGVVLFGNEPEKPAKPS